MNRHCLLSAVIATASVVACATVDQQQPQSAPPTSTQQPSGEPRYVTGSRIPVRDSTGSANVRSVDTKQGIDDMMQNKGVVTTAPKGN